MGDEPRSQSKQVLILRYNGTLDLARPTSNAGRPPKVSVGTDVRAFKKPESCV